MHPTLVGGDADASFLLSQCYQDRISAHILNQFTLSYPLITVLIRRTRKESKGTYSRPGLFSGVTVPHSMLMTSATHVLTIWQFLKNWKIVSVQITDAERTLQLENGPPCQSPISGAGLNLFYISLSSRYVYPPHVIKYLRGHGIFLVSWILRDVPPLPCISDLWL